eukprot:4164977-Amphidinium_carterae.1
MAPREVYGGATKPIHTINLGKLHKRRAPRKTNIGKPVRRAVATRPAKPTRLKAFWRSKETPTECSPWM